jgi:hypothetical protein
MDITIHPQLATTHRKLTQVSSNLLVRAKMSANLRCIDIENYMESY